jgi:Fe-S-cluster containining protein
MDTGLPPYKFEKKDTQRMAERPNPQKDETIKGPQRGHNVWKEQGGPFDTNLITSEVCLQCAACCKTTTRTEKTKQRYVEEYIEYGIAMWGYSRDKFRVVQGKGKRWIISVTHNCVQLNKDNTCKLYDRRPKICKKYNCLWSANIDKRVPEAWPKIKKLLKPIA